MNQEMGKDIYESMAFEMSILSIEKRKNNKNIAWPLNL